MPAVATCSTGDGPEPDSVRLTP